MAFHKGAPTPHNEAKPGDFARTVLMPGDPLRAKFIAENYFTDVVCVNQVRGMLGYTGTYKGEKISVMGSGMGMPSMGIYSYELFAFYGVENIIRIGTAGAGSPSIKIMDVILADKAYSDSSYALEQHGFTGNCLLKTYEGVAMLMMSKFKHIFKKSVKNTLAASLILRDLKGLKKEMDYNEYGGAPIMGAAKPVFKAHGSSKAKTIKSALRLTKAYVEGNVVKEIADSIQALKGDSEE